MGAYHTEGSDDSMKLYIRRTIRKTMILMAMIVLRIGLNNTTTKYRYENDGYDTESFQKRTVIRTTW